jgi:hypothetical protein
MPRFQVKGTLTRDALADLWKHTLSRIPTVTGQLTYLASLRDSNTGTYRHHGFAATFGRDESVRALRESHEMVFRQWLGMSMAERADDLRDYLNSTGEPATTIAQYWRTSNYLTTLIPSSSLEMERELFRNDLEALLRIIQNEKAGAGSPQ